jgi:hypothetical protein
MASLKPMALLKPPNPYYYQPHYEIKNPQIKTVYDRLGSDVNKEPQKLMNERFYNPNFAIHCFSSMEDVETKVLTDKPEILIVHSDYVKRSAESTAHRKFDYRDIYHIKRKEGQEAIYYKDVIEFFVANGYGSMDANRMFLYDIQPVEHYESTRNHPWSLPVFALHWLIKDGNSGFDFQLSFTC